MPQSVFKNRAFAVDAIIIQNNQILLIKRGKDPFKDYWALPGGHVEWDESAEEALAREVKEETQLIVVSYKLFGLYSRPQRNPTQTIGAVYVVQTRGEAKFGDDAKDLRFFLLKDIPSNLAFDHNIIINDYLKSL